VTKSDQWFDEAKFLFRHQRYTPVMYLGGFVVECLLKAAMWDRRTNSKIRSLIFGSHDLETLLEASPFLAAQMEKDPLGIYMHFVRISNWNVRIRYNPKLVVQDDAKDFLGNLREVRKWLRNKL